MKDTYAIITGASRGIGKAIAERLGEMGYSLALISLPKENLVDVSTALSLQYKVNVKFLEIDLTLKDAAKKVKQWCMDEEINFTVLVNNAGLGYEGNFESFDASFYEYLLKINVLAPTLLTRELLPLIKESRQSWILNSSSFASFYSMPYKAVYASSKSYITHFSCALREEVKAYNISVSYLCPAGVDTYAASSQRIEQIGWLAKVGRKTPREVAVIAVKGMFKGKRKIIPGRINIFFYYLSLLVPARLKTYLIHNELCKYYPLEAVELQRTADRNRQ